MIKWLLVVVVAIVVLSLAGPFLSRYGLGRLPGDLTVKFRGKLVYIPITTTLILSLALTLLGRLI
ncbi:hypothetical protein DSM104443_03877 [Usitatibacter rugosus]|uniref:DUF2905 family protein n=1 Tax=Usitatibacter rugosus TaxID=2732067 RepID=A0A6M4H2G5_9PROT|nr:DUF2905 family protein [Usitatibacter rugosus]QJR12784.1 hypothetical protein DSM104443_03877 [Usitatibacter rugosus]